jgi:hypothetical protein
MDPTCWQGSCSDHSFYDSVCGYGIAQWTAASRKEGLLAYAGGTANAAQLDWQLGYVWHELTTTYSGALSELKAVSGNTQSSVYEASDRVLTYYEQDGTSGKSAREARAWIVFNDNPY